MNLLKYKSLYFAISFFVIIPGIFSLAKYGLRFSIDFTGGTLLEIQNSKIKSQNDKERFKSVLQNTGVEVYSIQETGSGTYLIRTKEIAAKTKDQAMVTLSREFGPSVEERFETVGPTIGQELTIKALQAVGIASLAIILYIAYAFREIPQPYSSWKFGVSAVVALLHDVLVVTGIFSILGHFYQVEIDALFVTALLTIIGFSVHDTIVVFDRIRENLRTMGERKNFEEVVNASLLQTMKRSINTSATALLVMLAVILFGGETIKHFAIALFIGIFSGTYSSIFNAAPLLAIWEEYKKK